MASMTAERKQGTSVESARPSPRAGFADFPPSSEITLQLREIVRLSTEFERRLGRVLAVNATDMTVMQHLMQSGPLSPSELARRLQISTAAATLAVDRLEAVGHAHRSPHPDDRRKIVVVPEPASIGRAAAELLPLVSGVAEVSESFTPDEAETIERFLKAVAGVYQNLIPEA